MPAWIWERAAAWRSSGSEVACAVRDLESVPVAGCEPVRRFSWGRRQRHRTGLQFMVSTGRLHGFESLEDPSGSLYFRKFFLAGRREAIVTLWHRAVERGEVNPDIDAETVTDLLFGPLIFRLMSGHQPLTPEEADKISATALGGLLRH